VDTVVSRLLAAHMPGYSVDAVVPFGEGADNVAYEVNGDLVVRFSKEPDPVRRARRVQREALLLWTVADISPVPVPVPIFTVAEEGCLAYFKIFGVPLLDLPADLRLTHGHSVGSEMGALLAALHAVPLEQMADLVGTDRTSPVEWRDDAASSFRTVADHVPAAYHAPVEAFLVAPPPEDGGRDVFSHHDLGIEHILFDPATSAISGVLDWSDAAFADPAYDFGLILRDLGPVALDAAFTGYGRDDPGLRERAVFYARCRVFEDLAYGLEMGREAYAEKSLAALAWLFPPAT
jgi:aminoglycoside phosphotransferase (APT) family kinase protein